MVFGFFEKKPWFFANPDFKSMNLLKLEDLFKLKVLTIMHSHFNFISQSDVCQYNTRNCNSLSIPAYNRAKSQATWFYQGIHLWNILPDPIKTLQSNYAFKKNLRIYLTRSYWVFLSLDNVLALCTNFLLRLHLF